MQRSLLIWGVTIIACAFAWTAASNEAHAQGAPLVLKINEVNQGEGGPRPAPGPFIEIRNVGQGPVDLSEYRLANADESILIPLAGTLDAFDYLVLCGTSGAPVPECDVMNADLPALAAETIQDLQFNLAGTFITEDDTDFTLSIADPVTRSGVSTGRIPDGQDVSPTTDWQLICPTPGELNDGNLGRCGVVVNEVDYDQGDTDDNRFIELAAYDRRNIGCGQVRIANDLFDETIIRIPSRTILEAGEFWVLCDDQSTMPECDQQFDASDDANCNQTPTAPVTLSDSELRGIGFFNLIGQTALFEVRVDSLSYLGSLDVYTETNPAPSDIASPGPISISRVPNLVDSQSGDLDFATVCATPGAENATDLSSCNLCGTNVVEGDEECDAGGENTADCDSDCTLPACGDGIFNAAAETCDASDPASPACNDSCGLDEGDDGAFARGSGGCSGTSGGTTGAALCLLLALSIALRRQQQ